MMNEINIKKVKKINLKDDQSADGFLITRICQVCKKQYVENFKRLCFAYNMIVKTSRDICIDCRLYRCSKLACAIRDMAADLSLEVVPEREACPTLVGRSNWGPSEELPAIIRKKLDKMPLTYPRNLKDKICPVPCDRCTEFRGDNSEAEFEVVNEGETHEFDAEQAHEVIKHRIQVLSEKIDNGSTEG